MTNSNSRLRQLAIFVLVVMALFPASVSGSEETQVRSMVQRVFQQLKSRDYSGLYDSLPSSSRARMSRERFVSALKRAQDIYVLDRMDIGPVRVSNRLAVVDTVLMGGWSLHFKRKARSSCSSTSCRKMASGELLPEITVRSGVSWPVIPLLHENF